MNIKNEKKNPPITISIICFVDFFRIIIIEIMFYFDIKKEKENPAVYFVVYNWK